VPETVQCPAKATKNGGYVGLSQFVVALVATQVVEMPHNEEKWYCRSADRWPESGTNKSRPKIFLFPRLKVVAAAVQRHRIETKGA
jgi:hypothetical protein